MKRGDVVLAVPRGDYGKPRPAVIVQSDLFNATHASLLVCLLTSDLIEAPLFRINVPPAPANGLHEPSQIMVDKVVALPRERIRAQLGVLDDEMLLAINRSLMLLLGLAGA